MKFVLKSMFSIVVLVCAFFVTQPGFGQQTQASLTGQVSDPQGATIPNATVTITNVDTAITRTVPSSGSGRYTVTNLNPGNYSVDVKAAGFSEKILKGIVLAVGQDASLDVALTLGATSDVVTVNAEAAVTDTESSSQGAVISNKEVVGLPLNQRTFYSLAELSPAAYLPGQASTLGFRGGFNVAGQNETSNTFTINGIDDNDQNVMAPSFRPSVEAIDQFQLLTGVYPAEYGRTSGGQVVVITKTGGNTIHGDVFEFLRNSQFDAKNFFTPVGAPTTFRRNQFGGTVGGPIVKDKAFFFLSYEALRLAQPTVVSTTVPNPATYNGNFSSVPTQIVKPSTVPGAAGTPYANNQVPIGDLDPIGRAILGTYPCPTGTPGFISGGCAGYSSNVQFAPYTLNEPRVENLDEGSARVDWKVTDKDSLLFQYNYFNDPSFEPNLSLCSSAQIPLYGCNQNQISTLAGVNYTHVFSAHWLNEFRFGFDRLEQPRIGQDIGNVAFPKPVGTFNDPTVSPALLGGVPTSTVTGYATVHPYSNLPQHRWDDHFNLVDNATWSHGSHNVKFGVNILQARYSDIYVADATGIFSFTGTSSTSTHNQTTGSSVSDLALGYANTSSRSPSAPNIHVRYNSYGAFLEDDYKVSRNLTLNLGVRYEYFAPVYDTRSILSNYLLPAAGSASAGTFIVANQNGTGGTVNNGDGNNFAPRVGLAYQPFGNSKTVVHASYGVFYNAPAIGNGVDLSLALNVPFRLNQTFTSSTNATTIVQSKLTAIAGTAASIVVNPYPSTPGATPNGTTAAPYQSVSPTAVDVNFRNQYVNEYGADVQQQLTPTMSVTIGYIGSESAKIARGVYPNQASLVTSATGVTGSQRPITGQVGPIPNPVNTENSLGNPLYVTLSNPVLYISEGHANFNALTVKGVKTASHGLAFLLAYTWAKSMDNTPGYASGSNASNGTPQNSFNLQAERGLSDFNVTNRIALSPVWELPFGKGKSYLTTGIPAFLAGGWQVSGIYQFDSGRPFTINISGTGNSGSLESADRPNQVANPNNGPKTVAQWFNTAAFVANPAGTFGNEHRNAIIGPTLNELDAAIQRSFIITERYSASIRFESFDVLNHPNFYNPLGATSAYFGTAKYGQLTQANDPRSCQFSAKINF